MATCEKIFCSPFRLELKYMRYFFIGLLATALCTFEFAVNAADRAAIAANDSKSSVATPNAPKHRVAVKGKPITKDPAALQMPVSPVRGTAEHTGRLIVMFQDHVAMRAPRTAGTDVESLFGADTSTTALLLAKYGCTIRQAIDVDPVKLQNLRSRAQQRSGKPTPDLASMMYLEGIAPSQLVVAGREFLAMPEVAWVEIEAKIELASPQEPPPPFVSCRPLFDPHCGSCGTCDEATAQPCSYPHPGGVNPTDPNEARGNCSDEPVCALVNSVRPGCAVCWDEICATFANLLGPSVFGAKGCYDTSLEGFPDCQGGYVGGWNPLQDSVFIANSPFQAHVLAGSANYACCAAVCAVDVTCCNVSWDAGCAAIAIGLYTDCYTSTPGFVDSNTGFPIRSGSPLSPFVANTPLFDASVLEDPIPQPNPDRNHYALALYTTNKKFPDPYSGVPPAPPNQFPPPVGNNEVWGNFMNVTGYRGGGLNLAAMDNLQSQFGDPTGLQLSRITVAVVEPSALVNHEDLKVAGLSKIIVEAGQTPLVTIDPAPPGNPVGSSYTAPMHGTATLGVLFAEENDFGVTGIVPKAIARFYPTDSFQAQQRLLTALTNAIDDLSTSTATDPNPGNVIVLPIAPTGQPLNTTFASANIIAMGLNAGVTIVLAAGNASQEIDPPIAGTESAIVVGGVWPGFQYLDNMIYPGLNYCRANMSNFSGEGAPVHVSAWGRGICTLGYGDLFCGINPAGTGSNEDVNAYEQNRLRSYTAGWGGTSAAAAQIGGVAARIQALAKQVYDGQPLSPDQVLKLFYDPLLPDQPNQFAQCGGNLTHFIEDFAQLGDTVGSDLGDPALVGGFPNLLEMGRGVITGVSFGNNLSTFQVVRGTLLSGTPFSIREVDNKFVKIRTERLTTSSSGLGPALYYPTAKRAVDIQVVRTTDLQSPQDLTQVSVRITGRTVSVSQALVLAFIYNYTTNRWNVMPPYLGVMTAANATLPQFTLPACISPSYIGIPTATGVDLAVRIIVIPQGGFGQTQIWFDQVEIMYNSPFGDVGTGCGGGAP